MKLFLLLIIPSGYVVYVIAGQLINWQRRMKRQQELTSAYERLVRQNGATIDYSERIGSRLIAIDSRNGKLIVMDHNGSQRKEECMSLFSVSAAKVFRERNRNGAIQRVVLRWKDKQHNVSQSICFFDHAHDPLTALTSLSKKAHHWKDRLNRWGPPGGAGSKQLLQGQTNPEKTNPNIS